MTDKEQLEAILTGLKIRMQKLTREIEEIDGDLLFFQEAQASDTVLDSIRHLEVKLQAKHSDRAALYDKFSRLKQKMQNID